MVMYIEGFAHRGYACVRSVTLYVQGEFQDIIVYVAIVYMFE